MGLRLSAPLAFGERYLRAFAVIRQPSDLGPYYAYWRLALTDMAKAEAFYQANKERLAFCEEFPAVLPGFYRRKNMRREWKAVAIWIDQPIENGELVAPERILCKYGIGPRTITDDLLEIASIFHKARLNPVSEEAYLWAVSHNHQWADDKTKPAQKQLVDIDDPDTRFF